MITFFYARSTLEQYFFNCELLSLIGLLIQVYKISILLIYVNIVYIYPNNIMIFSCVTLLGVLKGHVVKNWDHQYFKKKKYF